jgi:ParB family chromosome partitioning protein
MAVEQIDHVRSDVSAQPGPHHLPFERLTMVTKKPKGLGRGLEALLGPKVQEAPDTASYAESGLPSQLKLEQMVAGMYQPRTRMDEGALYALAESIKAQGIMQPILVRQLSDGPNAGKYEITAGERRFRASQLAAECNFVAQKPKKEKSRDVRRVEEELSDLLMAEVEVRVKKRVKRQGKMEEMGELSIQFGSLDELNGLIEKLRG